MSTSSTSSTVTQGPRLLRFRLRQLFGFITLCGVLLTLLVTVDWPWPLVIGFVALLVGGHVFAAMLGTRLRDSSKKIPLP